VDRRRQRDALHGPRPPHRRRARMGLRPRVRRRETRQGAGRGGREVLDRRQHEGRLEDRLPAGTTVSVLGGIAALALMLVAPVTGFAQPYPVPDTWGGDLLSRPRLTGSWGGIRDEMGKKGVVLDVDLILTPQAVATGGVDTGVKFWGNTEYTLNVDTQKLG